MMRLLPEYSVYIYGGLEVASERVLSTCKALELIAFMGTGWSDEGCIDAEASERFRIPVVNTPGANAASVAEATMALMLALQRQVVWLNNQSKLGTGRPIKLRDISGRRLGIIGLGNIGGRVAKHAAMGFRMEVAYCGPHPKPLLEKELKLQRKSLTELLAWSDFVTIHSPAKTTVDLIGESELACMRSDAFLINVSSPEVVSGPAIVEALATGRIAGAAFDGWYKQPTQLMQDFLALDDRKLIVLPRTAWLTEDSYGRMARMAIDNIKVAISGQTPPNQVNLLSGRP